MKKTTVILQNDPEGLEKTVSALKASQPVGLPTETVYGLAANALDSLACSRIFQVKNRPTDNPLICHISSLDMLSQLASDVPAKIRPVLDAFWPGPLTVLLPKRECVPDIVSAGLPTVGVRFPNHPVAQKIISMCGFPLAAPSANLSGRPSPTTAQHVLHDLDGRIEYIMEGGASSVGLESTVLDITSNPPMILRPGAITLTMLGKYLPDVEIYGSNPTKRDFRLEERPPTPGMKYKHYAPTAPVTMIRLGTGMEDRVLQYLELLPNRRIVRLCNQLRPDLPGVTKIYLSKTHDLQEIARNLFSGLRDADLLMPDLILAEAIDEDDQGLAFMNRLGKAASNEI